MLVATVLALSSAALHASWNMFVKAGRERDLMAWALFAFGSVLVLPALVVIGLPPLEVAPYIAGSALVHVAYVTGLVKAYTHGDFSLVYPLARGGGAFFAAIGGVLFLSDRLSVPSWVAIGIVGGGLASLIRPGASRESVSWALFTALTIATYTLIDSEGSRVAHELGGSDLASVRYSFALFPATAATISVANVARGRSRAFAKSIPATWKRYVLGAVFLVAAYTLVLVAVTYAQVGYVTMLRESSVVMGALAGWLLLNEPMGKPRVISSSIVVAGLVLLVAANLRGWSV